MNMTRAVNSIYYLKEIRDVAQQEKTRIWLVGGFLRDYCLNYKKNCFDIDFCVEKNVLRFVKKFSSAINAKFIVLDKQEQTYRVIVKIKNKIYAYDFSPMRGKSLEGDLRLRDFTINSLAALINDENYPLIDFCRSINDLKQGIIRSVDGQVLKNDPLRILRGFTFMANYGFKIEKKTLAAMKKHKKLLHKVSGERIGEEVLKIFNSGNSFAAIKLMDRLRILDEIIPDIKKARGVHQGGYHHLDVWKHSLETLRCFEDLYRTKIKNDLPVLNYFDEPLAQNRKRLQIIKLACLLHDIGKPRARARKNKRTIFYRHEEIGRKICEKTAMRFKLSSREREVLKNLVFWHLRPGYLADTKIPTARALYRYFRDTATEGVSTALLSLADWRATRGPLTKGNQRKNHEKVMLGLVDHYFAKLNEKPLPKIIDGCDIMKKFNLKPSPLVGMILKTVKEEHALGKVTTKEEAFAAAQRVIKKSGKKYV